MAIVPKSRPQADTHAVCRPDVIARPRVRRSSALTPASPAVATPPAPAPASNVAPGSGDRPAFDVGYKKPPRHTRFQPGQSGNRKGRPKGAKSIKTLVRELLTEKVSIKTATGPKRITRIKATLLKIVERAFTGDMRALQQLVHLYESSVPDEAIRPDTASPTTPADMDAGDRALLEALKTILLDGEEQS